jgi:hypothetical protein
MRNPTPNKTIRELDWRSTDGIDVQLLWNSVTNEVVVAVHETRSDESFEVRVAAADALLAFRHPYVYANRPATRHSIAA